MKLLSVVTASLLLAACAPDEKQPMGNSERSAVIYRGDSREDVSIQPNSKLSALAEATAVLVESDKLSLSRATNSWGLNSSRLKNQFPLCSDESHLEQPTLGFCSGVLIGPNKVLTAGHCFDEKDSCLNTKFIFGWNLNKSQNKSLPESEIYSCQKILALKNSHSSGLDYAIVELDRPVPKVTPVKIAKEVPRQKGEALLSLSYPLGLPLKKDVASVLEDITDRNSFKVEVDTFSGSSGSPLFNAEGELVGILSRGMEDILEDDIYRVQTEGGCINFNRCKNGVCFGESFLKASRIDL